MKNEFVATHVIETPTNRIYVHAVPTEDITMNAADRGGLVLYTEAEWEAYDNADWEFADNILLFQGKSWARERDNAILLTFDECEWTRVDGWNDDGTRCSDGS